MANFRVGQKVVYLGADRVVPTAHPLLPSLKKGSIYTVRRVDTRCYDLGYHDTPTLLIEEVSVPVEKTLIGFWEGGYRLDRFRPVVERKTSIEIFQRMLSPNNERVSA